MVLARLPEDDRETPPWQPLQPLGMGGHEGSSECLPQAPFIHSHQDTQEVIQEEGRWHSYFYQLIEAMCCLSLAEQGEKANTSMAAPLVPRDGGTPGLSVPAPSPLHPQASKLCKLSSKKREGGTPTASSQLIEANTSIVAAPVHSDGGTPGLSVPALGPSHPQASKICEKSSKKREGGTPTSYNQLIDANTSMPAPPAARDWETPGLSVPVQVPSHPQASKT